MRVLFAAFSAVRFFFYFSFTGGAVKASDE